MVCDGFKIRHQHTIYVMKSPTWSQAIVSFSTICIRRLNDIDLHFRTAVRGNWYQTHSHYSLWSTSIFLSSNFISNTQHYFIFMFWTSYSDKTIPQIPNVETTAINPADYHKNLIPRFQHRKSQSWGQDCALKTDHHGKGLWTTSCAYIRYR